MIKIYSPFLQSVGLKLDDENVDFQISFQSPLDMFVRSVLSESCWQLLELVDQVSNGLAQLLRLDGQPRLVLQLLNLLPNAGKFRPDAFEILREGTSDKRSKCV